MDFPPSPLYTSTVSISFFQVDSGYNTQTCTSSLMETAGAETSCQESDVQAYEAPHKVHFFKAKVRSSVLCTHLLQHKKRWLVVSNAVFILMTISACSCL